MADLTATDLAVVIPTRERWDILDLTLSSLSSQSVSGFETIVVVDGTDQDVPPLKADSVLVKRRAGPAAARNAGARATQRPIVVFLGDDTIPARDLLERHLATHRRHPEREAGVVGFVDWHDSVAGNRINAWLEWSGTQTWYASLAPEGEQEVSHWHFYTSNVSVKRELLLECGGFDEDFPFAAFEDIECAIRLSDLGLRLFYEPSATCHHLHDYDWPGLERRFGAMAVSERLMVEKHPSVAPGCLNRMKESMAHPALPVERFVEAVPPRMTRLDRLVRHQANRRYHRRLSPTYIAAWDRAEELCELRRYLGDRYDSARLVYGSPPPAPRTGAGPMPDGEQHDGEQPDGEQSDEDRLFELARQALADATDHVHSILLSHLPSQSRVLDYGCGIGAEGRRLAAVGLSVEFADRPGLPLTYLRWRLEQHGLPARVCELGVDALPTGLDAAFCLDTSGTGRDPVEVLHQLEELAPIVALRLGPETPGLTSQPELGTGTNRSRLVSRHALPDASTLLVYRREPARLAEPA